MKFISSPLEEQISESRSGSIDNEVSWADVMPMFRESVQYDEDSPSLNFRALRPPVTRLKGRILAPRIAISDPFDPELMAFMKSLTPLVQMEPAILGGMPVFKDTLVPVMHLFDYLLAGKSMNDFLLDFPSISREMATDVLGNEATLFYEEISRSKAIAHY